MSMVVLESPEAVSASPVVGILRSVTRDGVPFVDYPGSRYGPLRAKASAELAASLAPGSLVILLFENDDRTRPVIFAAVSERLANVDANAVAVKLVKEAVVDGKRVVLEAQDEIVLRCGKGSITVRADGKVVIKGTELVSRSSGANKIKGSVVNIN